MLTYLCCVLRSLIWAVNVLNRICAFNSCVHWCHGIDAKSFVCLLSLMYYSGNPSTMIKQHDNHRHVILILLLLYILCPASTTNLFQCEAIDLPLCVTLSAMLTLPQVQKCCVYQLKCFTALSSPHTGPPSAAIRGPGNHEDVWKGQSER